MNFRAITALLLCMFFFCYSAYALEEGDVEVEVLTPLVIDATPGEVVPISVRFFSHKDSDVSIYNEVLFPTGITTSEVELVPLVIEAGGEREHATSLGRSYLEPGGRGE